MVLSYGSWWSRAIISQSRAIISSSKICFRRYISCEKFIHEEHIYKFQSHVCSGRYKKVIKENFGATDKDVAFLDQAIDLLKRGLANPTSDAFLKDIDTKLAPFGISFSLLQLEDKDAIIDKDKIHQIIFTSNAFKVRQLTEAINDIFGLDSK